jgi:hypothetical protein
MKMFISAAGAAVVGVCVSCALAQHGGDVFLEMQGGVLVTGRLDGLEPVFPWAVFESEFGIPLPNTSLEPGFEAEPGSLPAGTVIGITIRRSLREWDGSGFVISPVQVRLTKDAGIAISPPGDPANCQGPTLIIGAANAGGGLHQHPAYELLAPATDGIYLLELEAWAGSPGNASSEPFYIVFNQNEDHKEFEEVVEWMEERLGVPCYANCDASTTSPALNVADFTCFLQKFAAGDCWANCDRSTTSPTLNVADFTCFLQKFAAGCPTR